MVNIRQVIEAEDRWLGLGKLIIQMPLLEKDSILLLKYPSYASIRGFKRMTISSPFQQFWLQLVRNSEINYGLLQQCSVDDVDMFEKLFKKMKINLRFDRSQAQMNPADLIERMHILQGEIAAGNYNPIIKNECVDIVKKLNRIGKISNEIMNDIIAELME